MDNIEVPGIPAVFGEVLRELRMSLNISQEELAFRAGVDRTFVSRIERGQRQPTITSLIALAAALGMNATELVRETELRVKEPVKGK